MDELGDRGLVSDSRFAEALVRSRIARGGGPLRIRSDLEARGVDPSVVEEALDSDDEEWEARARGAREKRFGAAPPRDRAEYARQARFLAGRGFTRRQVRRALEESRRE